MKFLPDNWRSATPRPSLAEIPESIRYSKWVGRGNLQSEHNESANSLKADIEVVLRHVGFGPIDVPISKRGCLHRPHAEDAARARLIGMAKDRIAGRAILGSALDNLMKGASGRAVQNMNLMLGFAETMGLEQVALFP